MKIQHSETRESPRRARRSLYHVVNHREAGQFDSMTGATIWALKNIGDWNWSVEPSPCVQVL